MIKIHRENTFVNLIGEYNPENGHTFIKAGSKYRLDETPSLLPHIKRFRVEVLNDIGGQDGLTTKDYEFKSAGSAASVLCGAMTNGLDFFYVDNTDNKTINEFVYGKNRNCKSNETVQGKDERKLKRNRSVFLLKKKVLKDSEYMCFINPEHETFITDNGTRYMEAHHLVPYKFQPDFSSSLQVEANIVCLCPQCHRELHYGKRRYELLEKLYDDRKESLREEGIEINTFDDLKKLYVLKRK